MIQFDIPLVFETYNKEKNYIIEFSQANESNVCVIYFSSNGIYYPNDEDTFVREIVKKNKFEWYKTRFLNAKKHIFVRDVFKQWYINGINNDINSINSLYEFLKYETKNYQLITIGSSAGGYAASLFGSLLKASMIFSFSAQYCLLDILQTEEDRKKNPIVIQFSENVNNFKFLNISDIIKNSQVPIFYFYPFYSKEDMEQSKTVSNLKNVYCFKINSQIHEIPITYSSLKKTINFDHSKMLQIHKKINGNVISPMEYDKYCVNFLTGLYNNVVGKIKTNIKKALARCI